MNKIYDTLIIGGGPAGLTAAIYCRRAGMDVAFIEKETPGGKMIKTFTIENYPGIKKIAGPDLALQMFEHATELGAEMLYGAVKNISVEGDKRVLLMDDGSKHYAKTIIIASGMAERKVGVAGEDKYYGKGVSYCAICDGSLYKGRDVVVVGGGNSAIEEGMYLSDIVRKVYLVHRRDVFRADAHALEKIKQRANVEMMLFWVVKQIHGDSVVRSATLENLKTGEQKTVEVGCIFPYIGLDPITYFAKELGIVTPDGFIAVNEKMETSVHGIFAAGDVNKKPLRQIATAVSDGAIAALAAKNYIDNNF